MQRLLILACSQRKRPEAPPLPALERYDGPAFRVLRRYRRLTHDNGLTIYILSAKFGLIPAKKPIPRYNRLMTPKRADGLRLSVIAVIRRAVRRYKPSEIFICAGKAYLRVLDGLPENGPSVLVATGGQGGKLASLKDWLSQKRDQHE